MRVLVAVALIVLFVEAVVALACFAGWHWLGGWPWGAVLVAGVILLIVAPWIGELRVEFDSGTGRAKVRAGWWGAARFTQKPPEMRGRVLGIPFRLRARPPRERRAPPAEAKPAVARRKRPRAWSIAQAVPAGLQLLLDLLVDAREVSVQVRAPSQNAYVDAGVAGVVGKREWGPFDVTVTGTGERRIAAQYRIGLFRAALAVLYAVVQGRAGRVMRG
jgi:hypothetical protein